MVSHESFEQFEKRLKLDAIKARAKGAKEGNDAEERKTAERAKKQAEVAKANAKHKAEKKKAKAAESVENTRFKMNLNTKRVQEARR